MAVFNIPFNEEFRGMVIDVMKHVRRQQYTPEMLWRASEDTRVHVFLLVEHGHEERGVCH